MPFQLIQESYFSDMENLTVKLRWRGRRLRVANPILKGKKKEQTNRSMNKRKSPTLDPINVSNWSLVKEQRQHSETKAVSPTNGAGTTGQPHTQE